MPTVSILMPVYNNERYLPDAIASLTPDLGPDVEVVAVNDGSTDRSGEILDAWSAPGVRVVHTPNRGVVSAATTAAEHATGRLLARMDGDDLNVPGRIVACRAMLDQRPDIDFVSTWVERINGDGDIIDELAFPWHEDDVHRRLYFGNPIINGSSMMRRAAFDAAGGYRPGVAEDYDLWERMTRRGKATIVPRVLYRYREYPTLETGRTLDRHAARLAEIQDSRWAALGAPKPPSPLHVLRWASRYRQAGGTAAQFYGWDLRNLARISNAHGHRARAAQFAVLAALANGGRPPS